MESYISVFGSVLTAICAGWSSKLIGTVVDPLMEAFLQVAIILGGIAFILMFTYMMIDEIDGILEYLAMGMYAVPAVITFLLPWNYSTVLFAVAVIVNVFVFGKEFALPDL